MISCMYECLVHCYLCTGTKARFWARTWRLSARVAHSWRAHKEGLRHIVVSETEDMVVSAGKGMAAGREGDVLRVWDLATSSAGA